jgi:hypothetical protein
MKKRKSGSKEGKGGNSPSQLIDARIKEQVIRVLAMGKEL